MIMKTIFYAKSKETLIIAIPKITGNIHQP